MANPGTLHFASNQIRPTGFQIRTFAHAEAKRATEEAVIHVQLFKKI